MAKTFCSSNFVFFVFLHKMDLRVYSTSPITSEGYPNRNKCFFFQVVAKQAIQYALLFSRHCFCCLSQG